MPRIVAEEGNGKEQNWTELQLRHDGILRLHCETFNVIPLCSPELVKRPDLCVLVGVLPVTEFSGGLPRRGVVLGSWALVSQSNPAKGVYCWHGFQQLGE